MKKYFFSFLIIFLFIISLFASYKAYLKTQVTNYDTLLTIEPGQSISSSLKKLSDNNFINFLYLKIYVYLNNIDKFQAGEYELNKPYSIVINNIHNGKTKNYLFTIKDGATIYDLLNEIELSFLKNDCPNLKCINHNFSSAEGLFMPETYFYTKGDLVSTILKKSHEDLLDNLNLIWKKKSLDNPLKTKYDALILASIIEKEAGSHDEKMKISSVFLSRINKNMRLQADPTIIYGILPNFNGDITRSNIRDKNNIYNTYVIDGLPPTPIASSSLQSIKAAILATPGEYLYFVANSKNSHYFSKTYEEHLEAIKKFGLDK